MESEITVVDGTPVLSKTIAHAETKLFRIKAVLAYLDGPVYDFSETVFQVNNPIPVYDSDNKHLGYANVGAIPTGVKRLVADISIDYACEERLLTETKQERFYPKMIGSIRTVTPALLDVDFKSPIKVGLVVINSIVLTRKQLKDNRVPVFGEMVL